MPQPPPATLPAQPQPVMAQPVVSADEAPRRKVSPVHVVIGLAIILAGIAGFALVFTFAAQGPASDPGAAPTPAPLATPAPAPLPAAPAATAPAPVSRAQANAQAPSAPRLPSVDPGPMPEEHAGAAATVERYRDSLARGARARSRGDLEVALSSYRFAAHLKPRSTDAALGIARTYLDAQQPADALRWAERARDVETRGIEGRLMVGDVLLSMGRHDQAIATWREAQTLAPRERAPEERIRRAEEDLAEED